jgi:hypothetical protein
MTPKRFRLETAHNGYVNVEWRVDGLDVTLGRDEQGFAVTERGDILTAEEACPDCRVGKGCQAARYKHAVPAEYILRGGKSKGLDEMDPLDRRGSR